MIQPFLDSQINCVSKLSKTKVGALFMEAGTGKTRSAMELIKSTDTDYIVWFTPFQTKKNLKSEIDKWGGLNCDIVGIESIQNSDRIYLEIYNKLSNSNNATIVMDESLKIKNNDAKRTKRMIQLRNLSEYRLILNGTPLSKNLLDIYSQIEFLSPKILNMDMSEFKNTFCEYINIKYGMSGYSRSFTKEFIKKYHNIDHLYKLIDPFIFESKLSLSVGQQHIDIQYELSDSELKEHENLKNKYLDNEVMQAINNNIFLLITQKMQHNYSLSQQKFTIVDNLLKGVNQSKVLIYAKYIETQKQLSEYYPKCRVMSIQKHAYGLNLQDYNVTIFWDKTWDYALREQIERRTLRTGQSEDCLYYDLTGNVGLEQMINKNIANKRNLLDVFAGMSVKQLKKEL
jgi:SNF2 family DNA or RNA helicase